MNDIRVLIVDDSAVVRQVLTEQLTSVGGIKVIGAVSDPLFALNFLKKEWPDVIVLDIEMPRMDGITFLKHIMTERPTPVVICSTLTEQGRRRDAPGPQRRGGGHHHQAQGGVEGLSSGFSHPAGGHGQGGGPGPGFPCPPSLYPGAGAGGGA